MSGIVDIHRVVVHDRIKNARRASQEIPKSHLARPIVFRTRRRNILMPARGVLLRSLSLVVRSRRVQVDVIGRVIHWEM